MKILETINIEPSTNLIDVVASEYSFNSAVADLIDNCIDGQATKVDLFFLKNHDDYSLIIVDNGKGLSKTKLHEAAVIGYKSSNASRDNNILGRFSTGLKSASNYLSKRVYVLSKIKEKNENVLLIDFEELISKGEWIGKFVDDFPFDLRISEKGTAICCDDLRGIFDKNSLINKIDSLKNYIEHVFGKFLLQNKLIISIRTSLEGKPVYLKGWDPFFLPKNKSTKCILEKTILYKNNNIFLKIYILPSYSSLISSDQVYMSGNCEYYNLNKLQGFYIYRNERLISEGGWLLPGLDLTDKTRYARVEVNIPSSLDKEFGINLTKSKVTIPFDLVPRFKAIASTARAESNKNYNYKKHPETKPKLNKEEESIWVSVNTTNGVALRLNKNSVVLRELCKNLNDTQFDQLLNVIGKSFPLALATTQNIMPEKYTENEIETMTRNVYKSLKEQGISAQEIRKKIVRMEPFSRYTLLVINFFDKLEEDETKC